MMKPDFAVWRKDMKLRNPFCNLSRFEWLLWICSIIVVSASFVLAGENMGPSKLEKAQKLGVQIMSEEEFLQFVMHNS